MNVYFSNRVWWIIEMNISIIHSFDKGFRSITKVLPTFFLRYVLIPSYDLFNASADVKCRKAYILKSGIYNKCVQTLF